MDPKDLKHGHGTRGEYERVIARGASALDRADAEELVACGALLFEPFHDDENARRLLSQAAGRFPDDARPLFWLAKIAVHRECDEDRARQYVEAALKREPDRPECLSLLVSLLIDDARQLERCRQLADRLVERADDWPMAHTVRAQVMERQGRLAQAEDGYLMALRLIQQPVDERVPDTYFETVETGRRAERVLAEWIEERLTAVRKARAIIEGSDN
jgi:tetratricopeptide (TPR) repeat protein